VRKAGDGDIRLEAAGSPAWMRKALHDLCQPLTTLDCLLYLSPASGAGEVEDSKVLHRALEGAAVECGRMITIVREMQTRMAAEEHETRLRSSARH
jgi:hypothetical protein